MELLEQAIVFFQSVLEQFIFLLLLLGMSYIFAIPRKCKKCGGETSKEKTDWAETIGGTLLQTVISGSASGGHSSKKVCAKCGQIWPTDPEGIGGAIYYLCFMLVIASAIYHGHQFLGDLSR